MDEITRLINDLIRILQNISEEDYEIMELRGVEINEIKQELGSWFIADYSLYQGS
ncbi:MAG: hypothetical protein KAV25_06640 [Methanophagales archaeon]|jgi:hypothetical protein|nr:hypothetical protein [Methanophagales archaeon]